MCATHGQLDVRNITKFILFQKKIFTLLLCTIKQHPPRTRTRSALTVRLEGEMFMVYLF